MGAVSSIQPVPATSIDVAGSNQSTSLAGRCRLYGAGEDIDAAKGEPLAPGQDSFPSLSFHHRGEHWDEGISTGYRAKAVDANLSVQTTTELAEMAALPSSTDAVEMAKKMQSINAAAVNGEKSLLLKLIDGNSRLLLTQNEFGRSA